MKTGLEVPKAAHDSLLNFKLKDLVKLYKRDKVEFKSWVKFSSYSLVEVGSFRQPYL